MRHTILSGLVFCAILAIARAGDDGTGNDDPLLLHPDAIPDPRRLAPIPLTTKTVPLPMNNAKTRDLLDEMNQHVEGMDLKKVSWDHIYGPGYHDSSPPADVSGPYKEPLRAVPPVKMYDAFLFNPADPWQRSRHPVRRNDLVKEYKKMDFSPLRYLEVNKKGAVDPNTAKNPRYFPHVVRMGDLESFHPWSDINGNPLQEKPQAYVREADEQPLVTVARKQTRVTQPPILEKVKPHSNDMDYFSLPKFKQVPRNKNPRILQYDISDHKDAVEHANRVVSHPFKASADAAPRFRQATGHRTRAHMKAHAQAQAHSQAKTQDYPPKTLAFGAYGGEHPSDSPFDPEHLAGPRPPAKSTHLAPFNGDPTTYKVSTTAFDVNTETNPDRKEFDLQVKNQQSTEATTLLKDPRLPFLYDNGQQPGPGSPEYKKAPAPDARLVHSSTGRAPNPPVEIEQNGLRLEASRVLNVPFSHPVHFTRTKVGTPADYPKQYPGANPYKESTYPSRVAGPDAASQAVIDQDGLRAADAVADADQSMSFRQIRHASMTTTAPRMHVGRFGHLEYDTPSKPELTLKHDEYAHRAPIFLEQQVIITPKIPSYASLLEQVDDRIFSQTLSPQNAPDSPLALLATKSAAAFTTSAAVNTPSEIENKDSIASIIGDWDFSYLKGDKHENENQLNEVSDMRFMQSRSSPSTFNSDVVSEDDSIGDYIMLDEDKPQSVDNAPAAPVVSISSEAETEDMRFMQAGVSAEATATSQATSKVSTQTKAKVKSAANAKARSKFRSKTHSQAHSHSRFRTRSRVHHTPYHSSINHANQYKHRESKKQMKNTERLFAFLESGKTHAPQTAQPHLRAHLRSHRMKTIPHSADAYGTARKHTGRDASFGIDGVWLQQKSRNLDNYGASLLKVSSHHNSRSHYTTHGRADVSEAERGGVHAHSAETEPWWDSQSGRATNVMHAANSQASFVEHSGSSKLTPNGYGIPLKHAIQQPVTSIPKTSGGYATENVINSAESQPETIESFLGGFKVPGEGTTVEQMPPKEKGYTLNDPKGGAPPAETTFSTDMGDVNRPGEPVPPLPRSGEDEGVPTVVERDFGHGVGPETGGSIDDPDTRPATFDNPFADKYNSPDNEGFDMSTAVGTSEAAYIARSGNPLDAESPEERAQRQMIEEQLEEHEQPREFNPQTMHDAVVKLLGTSRGTEGSEQEAETPPGAVQDPEAAEPEDTIPMVIA